MNKKLLFIYCLLFIISGCQENWNTLEDWEELYSVYGILNMKDTAQYIRINKVFASADDPYNYTNFSDSVHVNPDHFHVTLKRYIDGVPHGDPIPLYPSNDYPKEEGQFATDSYITFKTTYRLQTNSEYKLKVRNTETGYEMSAKTASFGLRTLHQSFIEKKYFNSTQYSPEQIDYDGSLIPDQFEKMIQRFLYLEITATDTTEKVLDWRPWLDHYKNGKTDSTQQFSESFFQHIGSQLVENANVSRQAIGVDKALILNTEEMDLFIELSNSGTSLHYDPRFTNFDQGTGFIGWRYYYTFFGIDLKDETLDSLSYGQYTEHLNFLDANGNKK